MRDARRGLGVAGNLTNIVWQATANRGDTPSLGEPGQLEPRRPYELLCRFGFRKQVTETGDPGWSWADKVNWTPDQAGPAHRRDANHHHPWHLGRDALGVEAQDLASTLTVSQDSYAYLDTDPLRRSPQRPPPGQHYRDVHLVLLRPGH